jgi:SAM-dependent methyltransferase
MKQDEWAELQQLEFEYHEAKDEARVLTYKLPYWRTLLEALPEEARPGADSRVLEIGCGGCGIVLALEQGELVGIDPLMDRYLEKFPYLAERSDIEWVNGTAEGANYENRFDVVFAINSFDHVHDPGLVVEKIATSLRPGGHCVLTLNSHNTRFFRAYYSLLYKLIDPHHPYQFTPEQFVRLFSGFTPVLLREVDDLWFPFAEGYYRDVLGRSFSSKKKWLRAAMNPFKWPMGLLKFGWDMPPHKKRAGQRSIYSDYLYVFRLD